MVHRDVSQLPPGEVVALPVEELALLILQDVSAAVGHINRHNWMAGVQQRGMHGGLDSAALRAFSEAWAWLIVKGLVAPDPTQHGADWVFITRRGEEVLRAGLPVIRATERLDVELHRLLEGKPRRLFLTGDYELAVLAAMRQVEIRVREMIEAPSGLVGTKLMQRAFGDGGRLRDPAADGGEQVATMELFKGAMGAFKNPTSHRIVEFDDPIHAAEVILFADLLMRMLDRAGKDAAPERGT